MNHRATNTSWLDYPWQLPLYTVTTIAATPILVVAPHPDDETLGCGGAIAALRALGLSLSILVISDGTRSHPNSVAYPASKLKALRVAETRSAMHLLGMHRDQVTFFEVLDGSIPFPGEVGFDPVLERCRHYLAALTPAIVFLPWRADPHPDHRATWHLINRALIKCGLMPRLLEYPIWDWDKAQRQPSEDALAMIPWRLDISDTVQLKQKAIAAYRSQITNLIDDDPQGFRLSPHMIANFSQPWELYFEEEFSHESSKIACP